MSISTTSSLSAINPAQWDELLQQSPYSNFFQSRQCYAFLQATGCLLPFVVGVHEDGQLRGLMLGFIQQEGGKFKRFFSRRAIINAGPLLAEDISDEALVALLKACKQLLRGQAIYIETRNFFDYSRYKSAFAQVGFTYEEHLNFHIDTSSEEVFLQAMGKSRKRDAKATLQAGATVIDSPTLEEVRQYYAVLADLYRTKVKTPLFPLSFFEALHQSECGKLILVKYADEIVGGTVCVGLPNTPLYEWFVCGKDGVYKNVHASTLSTFSGIQYAATHSFPCFDMMGAGTPKDSYGVRDFKAKFGGTLVEQGRFVCVVNKLLFTIGKLGVKILKKL